LVDAVQEQGTSVSAISTKETSAGATNVNAPGAGTLLPELSLLAFLKQPCVMTLKTIAAIIIVTMVQDCHFLVDIIQQLLSGAETILRRSFDILVLAINYFFISGNLT
jgi:hypothetical protein